MKRNDVKQKQRLVSDVFGCIFPKAEGFACSRQCLGVKWYDDISLKGNEEFKALQRTERPQILSHCSTHSFRHTSIYLQINLSPPPHPT